jgi:anti-sigma B factor antagonist
MEITSSESGDVSIANVSGDIDGKSAPEAQAQLIALLSKKPRLVVDMSRVGFLSSGGLRMLLLLYRQAASQNGRLVVVGLSDEIKDTMSMTGFLRFFTIASTVEEGMKLVGGASA